MGEARLSVICGFFAFDTKSPLSFGNQMISSLHDIPIDKIEFWHNDKVFLSCHHQFITPESTSEVLPYYDREAGIAIVANAIIDNREELFAIFNIPSNKWEEFTDSQLILLAYKKWGEDCAKHLLGDFTYVIYEERNNKLVCTRDHAGRSTFYYTKNESYFAFCTIMKPLLAINDDKALNEQWIADFLSIPTVIGELDTSLTVYNAINQLPSAHTLFLTGRGIQLTKYWDPLKAPIIRFKSDEEYDEAFRELLSEATRCKLRSIGNVGILLSGGLDSCTIGSIAAGILQEKGDKLKSYTSIPMEGYIERYGNNAISDESSYVREMLERYKNIDASFCRSEGKNSFSDIDKYLDIIEQPYKTVENLFWHMDLYEKANKDNCKVVLSGQYGNITISYGDFATQFQTLLTSGKINKLYHEIKMFSQNYNISRKKIIKDIMRGALPSSIQRLLLQDDKKDRFLRSFLLIDPIFAKQYNEDIRIRNARYDNRPYKNPTLNEFRRLAMEHPGLSQIAAFENKIDIQNGLITRDPTKDKRIIEFCFSIPGDQYIRNGRDRVILRRSMKGIISDKIRMNYLKRGVQAADWVQRIIPYWEDINGQLDKYIFDERIEKYVNSKNISNFLSKNKHISINNNSVDIRQVMIIYIFSKFLLKGGE